MLQLKPVFGQNGERVMLKSLLTGLMLVLMIANVQAGGNPGESAMNCVGTSTEGDKLIFKNRCGKDIFVVWCGELKYSKKRCGDGPKNHFFTKSANIKPYGEATAWIDGRYEYAACVGGIGFGSKGIIADAGDNGRFRCEPTGSYR